MNRSAVTWGEVRRDRALVAVFVAVLLVAMLGFCGLSVDVGYMYVARGDMQRTADASALAGASALMSSDGEVLARAIEVAADNTVNHQSVTPAELDVVIGNWEANQKLFVPVAGGEALAPNAVRVVGTRQDMDLFFGSLLGIAKTDVSKMAVAVHGAGRCAGIWGLEGVIAAGSIITDSYDSDQGLYGAGNLYPNGDVCSCQDLIVNGDMEIHGDAMYGQGYDFVPHGSTYEIWGAVDDHACGTPSFEADFPGAAATNDNGTIGLTDRGRDPFRGSPWDLYVGSTDNLTLHGGTYYFTSVSIGGQGTLTIAGPTTMYVTGSAHFEGGGLFNTSQHPPDLVIYCSGPSVRIRGNAGFYGAIIAPQADVHFAGTSDIYGTVLGRTLGLYGDTVVHVDERLMFSLFDLESEAPAIVK